MLLDLTQPVLIPVLVIHKYGKCGAVISADIKRKGNFGSSANK
jgi:hypothetical protein